MRVSVKTTGSLFQEPQSTPLKAPFSESESESVHLSVRLNVIVCENLSGDDYNGHLELAMSGHPFTFVVH